MSPSEISDYVAAIYPANTRKVLVPYSYSLTFAALAAGASATQQLPITANADFLHLQTGYRAAIANAAQTVNSVPAPLARILITDSGTNEQFMASAIDITVYASQGINVEGDHVFPRIISGRSALTVALTSYEAANTNNIDVIFSGVLIRVFNNA